jgi:hypothetical protein
MANAICRASRLFILTDMKTTIYWNHFRKAFDKRVMKNIYHHTERGFEKLTLLVTAIISNSITFIIALCTVIFWLSNKRFYTQDIHAAIGDVILGVTFLTLFIIQRSFNHFSASLHLKVNELVASHKAANNAVMNA